MKKSFSLVFGILLFVVLGCSMLNKKQDKIDTPTPGKDTVSTPSDTTKPSTSTDAASLSMDKYEQIKNGMSYAEVSKLLGSAGTESRSSTVGKIELKSFKWEGDKTQRIYVNFRDDKVNSKSQSGLSGSSVSKDGDAEISMDKYNQLKNDMSYEEAVKVIGSAGEQSNNSKIGNTEISSYRWKGANYSNIFATFKDNKLTSKSQSGLK
jgi:hypothetical protein